MKVKSESKVAQSCPTRRDPMDCSLPGSSVHGIFQARVLEWGTIAFSTYHANWLLKKKKKKTVLRHCLSLKPSQKYGGVGHALPSPARTPKLQFTAERLSAGVCWILPRSQGQRRSPSKTLGGVKSHLESNPYLPESSNKPYAHQDPETPQTLSQTVFECLLGRDDSAVACRRGRGSGCSRPGHGISPLGGGSH